MGQSDEGKVVSFRSLARGFAGLLKGIPQAEGITIDNEGYLYVVSEPNLFYRFTQEKDWSVIKPRVAQKAADSVSCARASMISISSKCLGNSRLSQPLGTKW